MVAGTKGLPSGSRGRAILQCAVYAIQESRWDDLTLLLQSHASELQIARRNLEAKALERQAAQAARAAATAAAAAAAAEEEEEEEKALPRVPPARGEEEGPGYTESSSRLGRAVGVAVSWADQAPWMALLVVQVLILASYLPAFAYRGFIMDDTVAIEKNLNVVGPTLSLAELLSRDFWGLPMFGSGWTNKSFRPLVTWSYRLNYLLHGLDSSGFHATNVLLHGLASALVGRTASVTLGLPGSWGAGASLLFGLHPVHTENVLYLVGRADVAAACFAFAALNAYSGFFCPLQQLSTRAVDAGRNDQQAWGFWWLVLPVLLVIASGLCKETGFTFFALFFGMEVLDWISAAERHQAGHLLAMTSRARRRLRLQLSLRLGLLLTSVLLTFAARYRHTGGTTLNMSPQDNPISFEASWKVRLLSYAYLHGVYAKLLAWPQFLCYDYSMDAIPALRTLTDVRLLLPLATYTGVFAALAAASRAGPRYRRASLVSLAALVLPFLPASNILFPVGTVIGERLLYIPSAGFVLILLVWLHAAVGLPPAQGSDVALAEANGAPSLGDAPGTTSKSESRRATRRGSRAASRGPSRRVSAGPTANGQAAAEELAGVAMSRSMLGATAAVAALSAMLGVRTFVRVREWESGERLFLADGHRQLTSSKTQFNLGITYMQRQEWDAAIQALVRCAYADPLSSLPFYRIGQIEILRGRFESAESWLAAALDKFGASLMVRDEEVFHDLALAMFQNGKVEAAEKRLNVALQLNPDFAKGWNNLACCIASRNLQDAVRAARRAVSLAPENPQYWANVALLSHHVGDHATAASALQQAAALLPGLPEPRDCTWEFAPA